MRILFISYSDSGGGAAIAALRLARAMRADGHEVVLGVYEKHTSEEFVVEMPRKTGFLSRARRFAIKRIDKALFRRFVTDNRSLHSMNSYSLVDVRWINEYACDLVSLHWINHNLLSIRDIARIRKPVVWTMHDSWPFCGAEHCIDILNSDERYRIGYAGTKPVSSSGPDLPRIVFTRKARYWKTFKAFFVSPSGWQAEKFEVSALRMSHPEWRCAVIPNIVPSDRFSPMEKALSKRAMGIDADTIVIGFGSAYLVSGKPSYKGGHLLIDTLHEMKRRNKASKCILLIMGETDPGFIRAADMPVLVTGMLANERLQKLAYCCCDVFVCPSIIESFGLMALEAIACGTPVAAFNTSGISEVVRHRSTGYLARPFDPVDLENGIEWCLENAKRASGECSSLFLEKYNESWIVEKHIEFFSERIRGCNSQTA